MTSKLTQPGRSLVRSETCRHLIEILTFSVTNALDQEFLHYYADPGRYVINVTAYNLHSEPEFGYVKYTHNMTRVINVQIPVENFTIDFGTPAKWLDTDGGQSLLV